MHRISRNAPRGAAFLLLAASWRRFADRRARGVADHRRAGGNHWRAGRAQPAPEQNTADRRRRPAARPLCGRTGRQRRTRAARRSTSKVKNSASPRSLSIVAARPGFDAQESGHRTVGRRSIFPRQVGSGRSRPYFESARRPYAVVRSFETESAVSTRQNNIKPRLDSPNE
jgi:hypothetical protein